MREIESKKSQQQINEIDSTNSLYKLVRFCTRFLATLLHNHFSQLFIRLVYINIIVVLFIGYD